jgi:hypothetical protein
MPLIPMCLRLEGPDRSAGQEYRIYDGQIQVRGLQQPEEDDGWHRVTADQLADHVKRNTVVAQWLERRLGWRRLLQACVAEQNMYHFGIANGEHGRSTTA